MGLWGKVWDGFIWPIGKLAAGAVAQRQGCVAVGSREGGIDG